MPEMKAARAYKGSSVLRLERVPVPEPGEQDVLVRVASAGLAPSTMKLLAKGVFLHLPTIPGHEAAGVVEQVGAAVDPALIGSRVRVHPMLSCGECVYCGSDREQMCAEAAMIGQGAFGTGALELYARYHDGGLAEFVRAPHWLIDRIPDDVGFDVAAKLHDFGNAVRALKCAGPLNAATAVITAATGTMGTASIVLAEHFGIGRLVLVGRSAERLAAARRLVPHLRTDTIALNDLSPGWETSGELTARIRDLVPSGPDAVLDYLPEGPGAEQGLRSLANGGVFVHMGGNAASIAIPMREMMIGCWRYVGTRACTRDDTATALHLLASGKVKAEQLITHRYTLDDVNTALTAVAERREPMWMGVVHP
ncbi:alcohol dehydrogenase catalytic domain-containing protein [Actinomadura violacea]|uniref:Alcohol dehydrogenase catalytic domain-containing protein n=1 Tax=Actinomadura violacea TaxID=2819934 RepID=A0ABS3RLH8_9ACTN|nr:alcohol dehydrogenase catalytic domain-containing protein [Actinomadura violacea]MBO2457595.1 alcohol dehydrogenase catalytic domain-containing protein [Actinomadura violacea]